MEENEVKKKRKYLLYFLAVYMLLVINSFIPSYTDPKGYISLGDHPSLRQEPNIIYWSIAVLSFIVCLKGTHSYLIWKGMEIKPKQTYLNIQIIVMGILISGVSYAFLCLLSYIPGIVIALINFKAI